MSQEISTLKGATYVVTPTTEGVVSMHDGTILVSFVAGAQTTFVAPTKSVIVSDDNALVDVYFNPAALSEQGSGRFMSHVRDTELHLSPAQRAQLETLLPGFSGSEPPAPEGALSSGEVGTHFALYAQPGEFQAPSAVYVSRVPWARWEGEDESGQWVNNESQVNEAVFGVAQKFMDNAGLQHECSTDTVEGVDDYNGKLWPFYWQHANYISDEHGIKHVTAIKGVHEDFDPRAKNVCSFGPAFWFFCCLERWFNPEKQAWETHDGTEAGTPLFQLWGISTRSWENLDAGRRAMLLAHGVTANDFHLWPSAQVWDEATEKLVPRSYWCHSAYFGGYEEREDGRERLASKPGLPMRNNVSYITLNNMYGNAPGCGGSANVNGFGMLFDIVKNANKNSQTIHRGVSSLNMALEKASLSTASPDYLFPIASAESFDVGCTVCLWQDTAGNSRNMPYKQSYAAQLGRIAAIETHELTLVDGSVAESLCLVIDPSTVEPFIVRTGADNNEAAEAAKALTDAGQYACCFATAGPALTGETDAVIGIHDGSRRDWASARHPYRVQGTEFMAGAWFLAADMVAVKGNGVTTVLVNGSEKTPQSNQFVILQAPVHVPRITANTLDSFLDGGYTPVAVMETEEGFILNVQLESIGVALPVAASGKGGSTSLGHGDNLWMSNSCTEFLMGGPLSYGNAGGSAGLRLFTSLSYADALLVGRD